MLATNCINCPKQLYIYKILVYFVLPILDNPTIPIVHRARNDTNINGS